ncbi:hypothetical protein [Pontibacter ruber]|uniref:Uncharacterized protein n=1 Tax=Pontibacter ruber TaxID=1343895 RepID=A0ABW5CUN6_9BACT|nr:hypothetical protein [Pontibacter ruber]
MILLSGGPSYGMIITILGALTGSAGIFIWLHIRAAKTLYYREGFSTSPIAQKALVYTFFLFAAAFTSLVAFYLLMILIGALLVTLGLQHM